MSLAYDIWESQLQTLLQRQRTPEESERWTGLFEANFGPFDAMEYLQSLELGREVKPR